ncbi:MAG TPA: AAA domain-containing protein [Desulfomonilaceae bacterium]|nr:AAA domain-containing protein [Desulfomonilaceae bacterium]
MTIEFSHPWAVLSVSFLRHQNYFGCLGSADDFRQDTKSSGRGFPGVERSFPCHLLHDRLPAMNGDGTRTDSIQGRVVRISSEPRTAAKGGYLFRGLELLDERDGRRVFVVFPIFAGDDLYEFPLLCWEDARVAAYDLLLNNELADGSVIYTASPDSDLILEPHRPISVTEAVDAAACIRSVDVRYRVGPDEPFWMAKGKLIHSLFDHLIYAGRKPPSKIFREAFQRALPAFMAVLPGSSVTAHLKTLEEEARTHFTNLKSWLKKHADSFSTAEVEIDRMSTRLGLKGRADAVFREGDRTLILELKSGKVPVEEHFLQLFAYSLLFSKNRETAGCEGYVLYSATGTSERLKDIKNKKRTILQGRNRSVALKHSYTVGGGCLPELKCGKNGRCFSRSACTRLFGISGGKSTPRFDGPEREYYDRWFQLLSAEGWVQETEFARVLDPDSLSERIAERVTIPAGELKIVERPLAPNSVQEPGLPHVAEISPDLVGTQSAAQESNTGQVRAELVLRGESADVTPGDEIILHQGNPCSADALRARVLDVQNGALLVGLKMPLAHAPDVKLPVEGESLLNDAEWFVDTVPFSRGREISRYALFGFFARGSERVIKAIVSGDAPETERKTDGEHVDKDPEMGTEDLCFSEGLTAELNEDQESAVIAALESDVYHLIHGPPGTGKTRVLARLIRLCLDRGERILVACSTNVALDRLLLAVMDLGVREFLRIGGRSTVSREFLRALKDLGSPPILLSDLCAAVSDFRSFKKHVSEVKLIGATAYQCAAHPLFLRRRFDRIIVDEAGQLDEPATLGPLALGPKFVLGGDHLQLPPVVKTRNGRDQGENPGLEQSLFERLYLSSPASRVSRLTMQYRMNREVQEIPSRVFYDGKLFPSPEAAARRLNLTPGVLNDSRIDKIIDPSLPVVFVNIQGSDGGKASPREAAAVGRIVRGLLAGGVLAREIGIITPYRAQQALIRKRLEESGDSSKFLSVDTVDRFQGGEREVILLSLARSDGVTSFLADRKRLNVSLSRARSKLILLGHGPVLRENELFASILQDLECIPLDPD